MEDAARLRGVIAKVAIATESAMTCDALRTSSHKVFVSVNSTLHSLDCALIHSSLPCGHVFSQRALQEQFVATVKLVVENNRRIPVNMQQPPYTSDAFQIMYRRHIVWNPTCPICHRRIPAPPREVKKLTDRAKAIRELTAEETVSHVGVDLHDQPTEGNLAAQWEEFFNLRRR